MSSEIEKNLILVRQNGFQSQADFRAITQRVRNLAPDIEPFIVNNSIGNAVTRRKAAGRPSLIVSFQALHRFRPARGRIYQGGYIPKPDQMRRLGAAGLPVLKSAVLTPELTLEDPNWGELVVLKPLALGYSSHGLGVSVQRRARVRYRAPQDYPADHPGRHGPMMVQRFVDSGERPCVYRVLTLFGVPLYAFLIRLDRSRPPLDCPDDELEAAVIASNSGERRRIMIEDEDVLDCARAVYPAIPEVPLQACDIIRDQRSGRLYVLEINAGGNTWQFSSKAARPMIEQMGGAHVLIDQFGAFDIAARVLAQRVRAEAE